MVWLKYTQVCDEVRPEINGKFIIIGLYANNVIVVPQVPIQVPVLTFFVMLESDTAGIHQFKARMEHIDSRTKVMEMSGNIQFPGASVGPTPIRLSPMPIPLPGKYRMTMNVSPGGQGNEFTCDFEVQLPVPQQLPQPVAGTQRNPGVGFRG